MSDKPRMPDLSESLAAELQRAVSSYEAFKQAEIPTDAKGFTAYHNACKAALMHMALLMKLMNGEKTDPGTAEPDWLAAARSALATETEEEDNDDVFSA